MGLEDYGTVKLEQLHLIKSLAFKAGFSEQVLPYPSLPQPTVVDVPETIGFEYRIPASISAEQEPTVDDDYVYTVDDDNDWLVNTLQDTTDDFEVGLRNDIHLELEETEASDSGSTENIDMEEDTLNDILADIQNATAIEALMQRTYTSLALPRESTLQCFKRLVNEEMWLPFNTTQPSPEEQEELRLFREF